MADIIHLASSEKPTLDKTCGVYEWMPSGEYRVKQMPGIGSWYNFSDEQFDSLVENAGELADGLGHERVFIIGRPK